jgi:CRP-like cAMP-binding protein
VFSATVPTFLLLKDEHRERIRKCIQIESFEKDEVIYHEHDNATAFYILREGLVKITSTDLRKPDRIINNGQSFGAGALDATPLKRVASATVLTNDVLCLRLIREDWLRVFKEVTDEMAEEIFNRLDLDGTGTVTRAELSIELTERWQQDKATTVSARTASFARMVEMSVDSLMDILDDDGDGVVTLQEFKSNLQQIPEDDYAPTAVETAVDSTPPPSWLVAQCPFHYYHVNPKTNQREGYTEEENQKIFEAQSRSQSSVGISDTVELRFGESAKSTKMAKASHTGICQVNLANQNTRIVEVLDKAALVNSTVEAEAATAPLAPDDDHAHPLVGTRAGHDLDV